MSGEMQSCTISTGFVLRDFYLLTDTVMLGMVLPNLTQLGGMQKIVDHDQSKKTWPSEPLLYYVSSLAASFCPSAAFPEYTNTTHHPPSIL